jgi:type IV pilus secretin PilQ/predicted competence protein
VVVASDALVLVQGTESRSLAGGLEIKIRTTSRPSYTTYDLNSPSRLAIDFDRASVDFGSWKDLAVENPYFEKLIATPFYGKVGGSVRVEFFLRGESTHELQPSDGGLTVTFYGQVSPNVAAAEAAAHAPDAEDNSGISLEVLTQEPAAESSAVVDLVDKLGEQLSGLASSPVAAPPAVVDEVISIDPGAIPSIPATAIVQGVQSTDVGATSSLPSDGVSVGSAVPPAPDSVPGPSGSVPAIIQPVSEPVNMAAIGAMDQGPAGPDALNQPILAQAPRTERIDFRDLEEARSAEDDIRLGGARLRDFPELAQVRSESLGSQSVQFQGEASSIGPAFTGEPISLDLKNVDIVELLRIFADLADMNMVIDQDVAGRITIRMREVPWDQAFIVILRQMGLGFTIEGNIIRVATLRRLNAEIRAEQQLREARIIAEPLNTEIFYLNYAVPSQLTRVLENQLSARGEILTDARTNSLIVKDVQSNIDRIRRLIEILDVRTKQVSIGAQIVTTSKTFTRDLGITWGGTLVADPAHGNDTGLSFPNDINTNFGVALPGGGNGFIGFNFGNLADTVNLNALLAASEAEGVTKTVSNPRVTTEDNVNASVRSGSLVPYQSSTVSGNTVIATVIFREAAISLTVTPHVTADGWIRMQVTVSADAPDFAVATAAGPPIRTNSLNTVVLVKDGDTFVIGGLNSSTEGENENRVPFLHRLPVIGRILFKNHRTSNVYDDLLFFITPSVIQDEAVKRRSLVFEHYDVKDEQTPSSAAPPVSPSNP